MNSDQPITTELTTDSILVVLDFDDPASTLRAALQDADIAAAKVHLLVVVPTVEYEERRRTRLRAGIPGPYTIDHLTDEAHRIARRAGREYLDPEADGFEAMGAVGRKRDCIREAVRGRDYERIYVPDQPRSIWQRLLGVGDLAAELTRGSPDTVSVISVADVVGPNGDESDGHAVFDLDGETTTRSPDT